ncbi:S49 family peptidase [Cupriavidus gilardii]|uniref:S49 family peptidase n=1 Tax=Cupriavidus gilardii TaxID=82541 RepID=UPI0007E404CA|nr:S49 family peptidase [Cupriavidus gilardii]
MKYPLLASLVFGQAHMIDPGKLDIILAVLGDRMGVTIEGLRAHGMGAWHDNDDPAKDGADVEASRGKAWADAGRGVGVLDVSGTLVHRASSMDAMSGLTSYAQLSAHFASMVNDPDVGHIVLSINSPGGSVNGAFDFTDEVFRARGVKPITAIVDDRAYSAAYAIASAADEIIVSRTGGVGSIGVVAAHMDRSALNERAGVKVTYIHAGARKVDGNPDAPLSDDARATLQAEVDRIYGLFVETVARNRGLSTDAVRGTEAGTFMGSAGATAGLADKVMAPRDALREIVARYQPAPTASTGRYLRAATAMRVRMS